MKQDDVNTVTVHCNVDADGNDLNRGGGRGQSPRVPKICTFKPTFCDGNSLFESLSHRSGTFPSKSIYWGSFPEATIPILGEQDGNIKSYIHDIPIETVVLC